MMSLNEDLVGRIGDNLAEVKRRMAAACERAGRNPASARLLCVTKQRPIAALHALHTLGEREFGENRVQELSGRVEEFPSNIEWHFIGSLQTNKAKYLPGLIQIVHSVDRVEIAAALQKSWEKENLVPPLRVLLQFNISGEVQKHGAQEQEAERFLKTVLAMNRLRVEGLMTMAPLTDDPELARPIFRSLAQLRNHLQQQSGYPLPELSMGMTGDYEVAIEEGATVVRVGTALFE